MGKTAKIIVLCLLFVAMSFDRKADAVPVSFNFNDAPFPGFVTAIETYMEGIYGSDITVAGAMTAIKSPSDKYVGVSVSGTTMEFSFSFNYAPITSVSFDWLLHPLEWISPNDFYFYAYADNQVFFSRHSSTFEEGGSGTTSFGTPVTTLKFTISGSAGMAGVDNLTVVSVPEPGTILLLGTGLLTVISRRRRFNNMAQMRTTCAFGGTENWSNIFRRSER